MEQILYAGDWELQFPRRVIGGVTVLLLCFYFLSSNAYKYEGNRTGGTVCESMNVPDGVISMEDSVLSESIGTVSIPKVKWEPADDVFGPVLQTKSLPDVETVSLPESGKYSQEISVSAAASEDTIPAESPVSEPASIPEYKVSFFGNGGIPENNTVTYEDTSLIAADMPAPHRLGKVFDGWYLDPECTIPFDETTINGNAMSLYAGWRDLDYFRCDDRGVITACTSSDAVKDGLVLLPSDECCTGIGANTFSGLEDLITDVYIPSNITEIDASAFQNLNHLMYIEVEAGNPSFYSQGGILYQTGGEPVAYPLWYTDAV